MARTIITTMFYELLIVILYVLINLLFTIKLPFLISLITYIVMGFIMFYHKGKNTLKVTWIDRYGIFLVLSALSFGAGLLQGNKFGDSLTLLINYFLRYIFPLFQLICLSGYNLGIRNSYMKTLDKLWSDTKITKRYVGLPFNRKI